MLGNGRTTVGIAVGRTWAMYNPGHFAMERI